MARGVGPSPPIVVAGFSALVEGGRAEHVGVFHFGSSCGRGGGVVAAGLGSEAHLAFDLFEQVDWGGDSDAGGAEDRL